MYHSSTIVKRKWWQDPFDILLQAKAFVSLNLRTSNSRTTTKATVIASYNVQVLYTTCFLFSTFAVTQQQFLNGLTDALSLQNFSL